MNKIKRYSMKAVAALLTATMSFSALPVYALSEAYNSDETVYDYNNYSFALHSNSGDIILNETEVSINGDVYTDNDLKYTGEDGKLSINGNLLKGNNNIYCEIPNYIDVINTAAEYDYTFQGDKEIKGSDINLSESSFYADEDVVLDNVNIIGEGNITAKYNIVMDLRSDDTEEQAAIIMSENGDITVNAAELSFEGVLYAPNGTVKINAKQIDFTGQIYAKNIEINGTVLKVQYKNFLPELLICDAGDDKTIYLEDSVTLSTLCNYNNAEIYYTAAPEQENLVSITAGSTLQPTFRFSEAGEYVITMHAKINGTTAVDTVTISVNPEPVVKYTSTEDFESGTLSSLTGSNDELKLSDIIGNSNSYNDFYSLNNDKGISVKKEQSKTSLNSASDSFDVNYILTGYGKTEYSKGNDVILLVDNSGSMSAKLNLLKETALKIVDYMGPTDRFALCDLAKVHLELTNDKETLTNAINNCTRGSGSSDYIGGISDYALPLFDEESQERDRFIIVLADGECTESRALEAANKAAEQGVRVFLFQLNTPNTSYRAMGDIAATTKGVYKVSLASDEISQSMLKIADAIYNIAGRNVKFSTTVTKAEYLDIQSVENAPDSIVYNDDGSVTVSWIYDSIDIDASEEIKIPFKTNLLPKNGYEVIAKDTKVVYYDRNGDGSVLYLDDVVIGKNNCSENGKWTSSVYDSGRDNCTWSLVNWNAEYVGNSKINVYLSTSDDGENFGTPIKVSNNQILSNLTGRYIKTEIEMIVSDDGSTPTLYDLTVYAQDGLRPDYSAQGNNVKICVENTVTENAPLTVWLDIKGNNDNISNISWDITNSENVSVKEYNELLKYITFKEEGTYTLKVTVTAGGITSEASVNIKVLPQEALHIDGDTTETSVLKMTVSETPDYLKYNSTLNFNISFNDPEQVAWLRVFYEISNNGTVSGRYLNVTIDEENGNIVSIPINRSNNYYIITVQAFDWYGNKCEEVRTIYCDNTRPIINLTSSTNSSLWCGLDEVIITATAEDESGIASIVLTYNDQEVTLDENGQYKFITEQPGYHTFKCIATDNSGLQAEKSISVNYREDTTKPNCYINGSNQVVLGNSIDITIGVNDYQTGIASFVCTLNGEEITISEDNIYTFKPDAVGDYVFEVVAVDNRGNEATVTKTIKCVADTNRPSVSIQLSNREVLVGESITVSVITSDNVAVTEIYFYENDVEKALSEENTYVYTADSEGLINNSYKTVTFKVVVRDAAGNENITYTNVKVIAEDTTKPNINLSCSSYYQIKQSNAFMTVSANDNIAVQELKVYVNDELVTLDENNRYYFNTDTFCEYNIRIVAVDTSGNENERTYVTKVADTTRPSIRVVTNKYYNSYLIGDTVEFTVTVSDNYLLGKISCTFDDQTQEIEKPDGITDSMSFTLTVEDIQAGSHTLTVNVTDSSENTNSYNYTIIVKDTVAPTVSISSDKDKYSKNEKPVIEYDISDNLAVTKVEAYINDTVIDYVDGELILPETYTEGEYTVKVKAYDAAGNTAEDSCTFTVVNSFDTTNPVITDYICSPEQWEVGKEAYITVNATDDSGTVNLKLTVGDQELQYSAFNGGYKFIPSVAGEATINIYAEDEAGNYTSVQFKKYVYESLENHKIVVTTEEVVPVNTEVKVVISSSDDLPFNTTSLYCNTTSTEITSETNTYTFTLNNVGEYTFTASGTDQENITDTKTFTIKAASSYEADINSESMQQYLAQTTETALNDELKGIADGFESPVDAYEYVFNNIAYECYINSRKGAVGAYELKLANDYDQASLLIGLCRYMGYPSRYVSGTILLTEAQAKSLMVTDDFYETGVMIASSGRNAKRLTDINKLQMDSVWAEVYVPYSMLGETDPTKKDLGVWVSLNTAIKASELKEYELEKQESSMNIDEIEKIYDDYKDTEISSVVEQLSSVTTEVNNTVFERTIVHQTFEKLPSELQYEVKTRSSDFAAVTASMSDRISFTMSDYFDDYNLGTYKTAELYGKRVTVQYVGNTGSGTIFELGQSAVMNNSFKPALTIDGEIVNYGPETTLGNEQRLYMNITTGGVSDSFSDILKAGSMYSVVLDVGGISSQTLSKAFEKAVSENPISLDDPEHANSQNYYDEEKVGSYLSFAGHLYFSLCDVYGKISAANDNIEIANRTKVLVTSYEVSMEENFLGYYCKVLPGKFFIDVDYNTIYSVSRSGDETTRDNYMFSTAFMESYYEGFIWELLLLQDAVSTVSIIDKAMENGSNLVFINSDNYETAIANVDATSSEKSEIKSAVNEGKTVIIPDKRVTINKWSGTGYIIADFVDYNHFTFKISGGLNGGSGTDSIDLGDGINNEFADLADDENIDLDKFIASSYAISQSLYYLLLLKTIPEVEASVSEFQAAAASGSNVATALTGVKLINSVMDLKDIMDYRCKMIEHFADYCFGDTEKAVKGYVVLISNMMCDLLGVSDDDLIEGSLKFLGIPEEALDINSFLENVVDVFSELLGGGDDEEE